MATEISRTFDLAGGMVQLVIDDNFGHRSNHTMYLSGVQDVNAAVTKLLEDTDVAAAVIRERMMAAGWSGQ